MPIDDTTTNRAYQKPNAANDLAYDVARLRAALDAIDADIQALDPGAGTTSTPPLKFTSGTNTTSAQAGAIEYDGTYIYGTPDSTSGRGAIPALQTFRLTADGTAITTIADFYGTTSAISLAASSAYEVSFYVYGQQGAGGSNNFTLTLVFSGTVTRCWAYYVSNDLASTATGTPLTGYVQGTTATQALPTISYTSGSIRHVLVKAYVQTNSAVSLKLQLTANASTTPKAGSWFTAMRLGPTTGAFV